MAKIHFQELFTRHLEKKFGRETAKGLKKNISLYCEKTRII